MNLQRIKVGLFGFTVIFLVLGYAASQWAFFNGRTAEYSRAMDGGAIPTVSLVLLLAFVVLAFFKSPVEEPSA